jgi:hypothetical protein
MFCAIQKIIHKNTFLYVAFFNAVGKPSSWPYLLLPTNFLCECKRNGIYLL